MPDSLRDRFPVLCRLREWSDLPQCIQGRGNWRRAQLEASLAAWLDNAHPGGAVSALWREHLAAGRCLLILDGVDEVPTESGDHLPRRNLLSGLKDALPAWISAGNRVLLTSRPYGLEASDRSTLKLPEATLADLPAPLQEAFVRRWYAAAGPFSRTVRHAHHAGPAQALPDAGKT